jgi:hypothetical protein
MGITPAAELMIRLSQGQLKVLTTCPRKFGYIYIDRLTQPTTPEQELKMRWGSQFHLLMQQRELGLPIESILESSPQLNSWLKSIVATAPALFELDPQSWRESEHPRTLAVDGYLFTAIYDLLILNPQQARIVDWKTYPLPKHKQDLQEDWQTRLYLYLLAETSEYLPKQITFTYWFIQSLPQPQSLEFKYTTKQHDRTQQELRQILSTLSELLDTLPPRGDAWPQIPESQGQCKFCHFAPRCDRTSIRSPSSSSIDMESVPSIEF